MRENPYPRPRAAALVGEGQGLESFRTRLIVIHAGGPPARFKFLMGWKTEAPPRRRVGGAS